MASEIGFEIACLRRIVDDEEGYRALMTELVQQAGDTPTSFSAFVLARSAGLAPQDSELARRAVDWGESSLSDGRSGWMLHALGLAHHRAGNDDLAAATLQESIDTGWEDSQNQVALALVCDAIDQTEQANHWLALARGWRDKQLERAGDGAVNVQVIDWLAFHALLREAEGRIDENGDVDETFR